MNPTAAPSARAARASDTASKEELIKIGCGVGPQDALSQANLTLNGLATYGGKLIEFGFPTSDGDRLLVVRDLAVAAGVGQASAKGTKTTSSTIWDVACSDALTLSAGRRGAVSKQIVGSGAEALFAIDVGKDRLFVVQPVYDALTAGEAYRVYYVLPGRNMLSFEPDDASGYRGAAPRALRQDPPERWSWNSSTTPPSPPTSRERSCCTAISCSPR